MSRRIVRSESGLGDLERYGLLALAAALLLALAFAAQKLSGEHAPFRSMAFRGADRLSRDARAELVLDPQAPALDAPGGGEIREPLPPRDEPELRPSFDFFEPPVRYPGAPARVAPPPPHLAAAVATRRVTVRRGDTLEKIAARELGSARRWRELLAANPGTDPRKLRPGAELAVPGPGREPPQPPRPKGRLHTVAADDTLQSIAQRYYGDRTRWIDLLEANREQLKDPTALRAGIQIRIP